MAETTKTVLLAEDDEHTRAVYATLLEHHGYTVLEAENGKEAVRVAGERRPDLVLMDVQMPVMDGWHATERLRADAGTEPIPVVVVTALPFAEHRDRAERVGCDGYLTKPCAPRRLLVEVRRLIG